MKKNIFAICMVTAAGCMATLTAQTKGAETLVP
jgi:heparin lyase